MHTDDADRAANTKLAQGAVMGALIAAPGRQYDVEPIMDGPNYTGAVLMTHKLTGNRYVVQVTAQEDL